jgi:tetratricopeptide (TPR) repeat protein
VRIWVLKESRLPIHMVVYQPDHKEFMLVVFDYTTAQPEEFFDLGNFEKAVAGKPGATPEEIYREGAGPAGGKPIDSRQAFKLKGGYKVPVLTNIESDDMGDLLITSENPRNRTPDGHPVIGTYWKQLFDNWGNTYWRLTPDELNDKKVLRQVYLAVPPFHPGDGRHTITLRYCVWGNDEGSQMNYDKIVSEETVEVPQPVVKGIPKGWPVVNRGDGSHERIVPYLPRDPLERAHALYEFHWARSPIWVQLGTVDPLLAKKPDDVRLLYEKLDILRFYNLDEDRFWLFERTLKDRALADAFDNWSLGNILGDYLIHLFNADRRGEFDALVKQLEPLKEKFLASTTDPNARSSQDSFRRYTNSLPVALAISKALAAIERGPRPTVEVLGRSRDGWLWLSVVRPPNRNHNSSDHSWSAPHVPKGSPWTLVRDWAVGDKVFLEVKGSGDTIQLDFDVMILPLVVNEGEKWYNSYNRIGWSMTVKVPAAMVATARELTPYRPKWLPGGGPGMSDSGAPSPFRLAWHNAERLFDAGQYAAALDAYREMLSWPRQSATAAAQNGKTVPDYIRESLQARPISCLLHLDRLDEAKAAADRVEAESPRSEGLYLKRGARVEIIDWLIDHKRLDEAQKALDQLNRSRADTRLLDCRTVLTKTSWGIQGGQPTSQNWRAWMGVDRVWWRLRQAQTGQRIPPVEP